MSYSLELRSLPVGLAQSATPADVEAALGRRRRSLEDFAALVSPAAAPAYLEEMARQAHELTLKHFGRVIRLFARCTLATSVSMSAVIAVSLTTI